MASQADTFLSEAKAALKSGATDRARDALLRILQEKPAHSKALAQLHEVMKQRLGVPPKPFSAALMQRLMHLRARSGPMAAAAEAAAISALNPRNAEAVSNHGAFLFEAGHLEPAEILLRAALRLNPDHAQACFNLVNLHFRKNNTGAALELIADFVGRHPEDATGWTLLGLARNEFRQFTTAAEAFSKAHELSPDDMDILHMLGTALFEADDLEAAQPILERVRAADPSRSRACANLGLIALAVGDRNRAREMFEGAVAITRTSGRDHYNLTLAKKFREGDPQLEAMLRLAEDRTLPDADRVLIEFGLARALEDLGRDDESFAHLERGNALRRAELTYSTEVFAARIETIKKNLGRNAPAARLSGEGPVPIFVLGMMRSGTTLTEQILSAHSQVAGAGELEHLSMLALPLSKDAEPSEDLATRIRESYLRSLAARAPGARYVVDKMPANFQWIGLIRKALPEARIVHLNRDPVAVCWSIYKRYFPADQVGFAYRMDELTEYYDLYEDIMSFWRAQYPGEFFDLSYDALTRDPQSVVASLLDHCGLPWEEACLSPQENVRAVRTASSQQVRKGIYLGSSEEWRRWERHIGPIVDHFADREA